MFRNLSVVIFVLSIALPHFIRYGRELQCQSIAALGIKYIYISLYCIFVTDEAVPLLFCIIGHLLHRWLLKLWNCPIRYFVTTVLSCSVYVNVPFLDVVHKQILCCRLSVCNKQVISTSQVIVFLDTIWSLLLYGRLVVSIKAVLMPLLSPSST